MPSGTGGASSRRFLLRLALNLLEHQTPDTAAMQGVDDPLAVGRDPGLIVDLFDGGLGEGAHLTGREIGPHDLGEAIAVAHRHGPAAVRGRIGIAQAGSAGEAPHLARLGLP